MRGGVSNSLFEGSPEEKGKKKKKNTNTNKLRATLSIIKADFSLGEGVFSREMVKVEALIQPRSPHKSFRRRESN